MENKTTKKRTRKTSSKGEKKMDWVEHAFAVVDKYGEFYVTDWKAVLK